MLKANSNENIHPLEIVCPSWRSRDKYYRLERVAQPAMEFVTGLYSSNWRLLLLLSRYFIKRLKIASLVFSLIHLTRYFLRLVNNFLIYYTKTETSYSFL